jgi:hypothetical protein
VNLFFFQLENSGRVNSQPLLVSLTDWSQALKIVVAADDGYVYIIDGETACYDKIDIGESSYTIIIIISLTNSLDTVWSLLRI